MGIHIQGDDGSGDHGGTVGVDGALHQRLQPDEIRGFVGNEAPLHGPHRQPRLVMTPIQPLPGGRGCRQIVAEQGGEPSIPAQRVEVIQALPVQGTQHDERFDELTVPDVAPDVLHDADGARLQQGEGGPDRSPMTIVQPDVQGPSFFLSQRDRLFGEGQVGVERLLDKDVFAGSQDRQGDGRVVIRRRADDDGVGLGVGDGRPPVGGRPALAP